MNYRFSAMTNIPSTRDTFTLLYRVVWLDKYGKTAGTTPIRTYSTSTAGWTPAVTALISPTNAVKARIEMVLNNFAATAYVDEVLFGK
jgi:hypothetical protein